MPGKESDHSVNENNIYSIPPFMYMHVLDEMANVTKVEAGPKMYVRKENERVLLEPQKMVIIPPYHYCIICNPVVRNAENALVYDSSGQIKLRHADLEVRFEQDPFPLYPGEVLFRDVTPSTVVQSNSALLLKANRDFEEAGVKLEAGDGWLEGPDTGRENDSDESFRKLFHDLSNEEFVPDYDYLKDDRKEEKIIEGENASKVISNFVKNMNGKELIEGDNSLRSHKECVNVKMQLKCSNLEKNRNDQKEIKDKNLLRNNVDCVGIKMECSNLQCKNDSGSIKNDYLPRNHRKCVNSANPNQIAEKIITPTQNVNKLVQPKVKATRRKIRNPDEWKRKPKVKATRSKIRNPDEWKTKPKVKATRSKIRNPDEWKRKKSAICREKGEAYINYKGEVQPAKSVFLGSLCPDTCRLQCAQAFTSKQRVKIFSSFYKLNINAKNALLYNSIKMKSIKRGRRGALNPRTASFEYNIACSGTQTKVCKRAFVLLYSISTGKINYIQSLMKKGLASPPLDRRGRHYTRPFKIPDNVIFYIIQHIFNLPVEESHCSKNCNIDKKYPFSQMSVPHLYKHYLEKCDTEQVGAQFKVKESTFRNILKKHCNFNYGLPKRDMCDSGSVKAE